jgi:hypothetical protein
MRVVIGPLSVLCLSAMVGCGSIPQSTPATNAVRAEFNRPSGPINSPDVLSISAAGIWADQDLHLNLLQ